MLDLATIKASIVSVLEYLIPNSLLYPESTQSFWEDLLLSSDGTKVVRA